MASSRSNASNKLPSSVLYQERNLTATRENWKSIDEAGHLLGKVTFSNKHVWKGKNVEIISLSRLDQFKFGAFLSHLILNTRFNSFNIFSPLSINPIDVSSEKFLTLRLSNSYLLPPLTTSYHCINFIIRAERASL